jgi:hypothetical protein
MSYWALFFHHQRPSEIISFSLAENTAQLVIISDNFCRPSRQMSVRCEAPGQEHDGKNKDYPVRNSILLKVAHNQRKYVSPRSSNVKLVIPTAFLPQACYRKRYATLCGTRHVRTQKWECG